MKTICLIDDLTYGIPQLINAIPKDFKYEFFYFSSVKDINRWDFDIVLLDYYLDKDGITGKEVISKINSSCIIAFSSEGSCNQELRSLGANFSIKKLQKTHQNILLQQFLQEYLKK
ncbi:MAG: hypothetical protein H6767_05195 [Candidatus Peribacteria bacterium]|nr:MAG: hypothetical protein H6767_05195 [Candidatus Peribacteria bacterium]